MPGRLLKTRNAYFISIKTLTKGTGFFDDACKEFYLRRLLHCQNAFQVQLHAYLLLEQQILLLFTPAMPSALNSFIHYLNKSYNNYYLVRFERKVRAWQDAPIANILPTDNLVLDSQKFLERYTIEFENRNHPGEYLYSSYCKNAFTLNPQTLKRHRSVMELLQGEANMLERYREFIASPFREEYARFLRSRLLTGRPLLCSNTSKRLEKHRTLADIKRSGAIAHIE